MGEDEKLKLHGCFITLINQDNFCNCVNYFTVI